jgi:hypothetical protein
VLWRHVSGLPAIWDNQERTEVAYHPLTDVGNDWQVVDSADFNGDSAGDLLWQHTSGQLAIWEIQDGPQSGYHFLGFVGPDWRPPTPATATPTFSGGMRPACPPSGTSRSASRSATIP